MPVSAAKISLSISWMSITPSESFQGVRAGHPDDHALELPVAGEREEVAVVRVVLRPVLELADVALLLYHLAGRLLDDRVLELVGGPRRCGEEAGEPGPVLAGSGEGSTVCLDRQRCVIVAM